VERKVEGEKETKYEMVCTTSFIQANLLQSIGASRVLSRKVSVKGIYMVLIQKPW
jgi:hypothetical protein